MRYRSELAMPVRTTNDMQCGPTTCRRVVKALVKYMLVACGGPIEHLFNNSRTILWWR